MILYLVQHAQPKPKEEDPERPLSQRGTEEITRMASHASKYLNIRARKIFHSGKLRARQTAEILAERLQPPDGIEEAEGLDPLASASIWASKLNQFSSDIMLVGHLPHLAKLASLLVCGDETREIVKFQMGGIACLTGEQPERWSLLWIVTPSII